MNNSHFEQEAEHQQFSISEKEDFTAAKLYDGSFSEAVSSVLKGIKSQIPADLELRPDGTMLLGTVPVDRNSISGALCTTGQELRSVQAESGSLRGSALSNAIRAALKPVQAHEDRNAMDKPKVDDAPKDGNEATPAQKNELHAYDVKREPVPVAPPPSDGTIGGGIGAASAAGAAAGAIGSVIRNGEAPQPHRENTNPITGALLQSLLLQNKPGGIVSGLKQVLPGKK
ncbi:MAG: hypothetical protein K2W95_25135 [Candidatus Obscuribacterales bacterium]|nr:hypothetical protein [Candidatus Obscuribacterales bacterium]